MGLRKRAMIGEGELWKRVGAERALRREKLDSFTQIVSEISRTSVAACQGGSFSLGIRRESGGGTAREHAIAFEIGLPPCEIISYRRDGKEDKLNRGLPKASLG